MDFYLGIHQPSDAKHLDRVFVSVTRLSGPKGRKRKFTDKPWIMDSGAFTTIAQHGGYPEPPAAYAKHIRRWAAPNLVAAVAQDFMCEEFMLAKTGLTLADHQRLTIERYDELRREDTTGVLIMPVLQGYDPDDYARHALAYGDRLVLGAYVGVGSVCKRNSHPQAIVAVLKAIHHARPDLRLHGFGLKTTSLAVKEIRDHLESADSLAWSFAARRQGRNQNDWREAATFADRITALAG